MPLTLHYGSGSPYAWKVWLALEHKQLPYELKLLSFDRGDTQDPAFLALNPRGKVPTLVDGEFSLWESSAILEYLEDRYPERPLLARDPETRALARRIAAEVGTYLSPAQGKLMAATLYTPADRRDPAAIDAARDAVIAELERFASYLRGDWFTGEFSLADLSVYPTLRLLQRNEERSPGLALLDRFPPALTAFMRRVAALPYHDKTLPPHWST